MTEPRGSIYLINRAPIDITYAHTIDFKSPEEQLSFWGSKVKYRLSEYSYIRRERRFLRVGKTYEELDGINYLYFHSREDSKVYYAFVTGREYVNDSETYIFFEIDVLQSFMFDYTFKPSYISQAHVDRWDANLKPIYSRTEEGLSYGTEYVTESAYRMKADAEDHGFYLIYTTGFDKNPDHGFTFSGDANIYGVTRINDNPIPYQLYIMPIMNEHTDNVIAFDGYPLSDMAEFHNFMANSSFGDFVQQIVYVKYLPIPYYLSPKGGDTGDGVYDRSIFFKGTIDGESWGDGSIITATSISNGQKRVTLLRVDKLDTGNVRETYASLGAFTGLEEKLPPSAEWDAIRAKPLTTERDRRFESKLLTFPYRFNFFTDWIGTPTIIKNEHVVGDKITVKGSIGFGFNVPRRFWIDNYRQDPEGRECSINQTIPLEQPITSDAYYTYMLQNRNQISANLTNAKVNAVVGVVGSIVNGAISGGATTGSAGGALGGGLVAGVWKGVESVVNINNMIRSENAKQSDIKALPDTISNSNDCTLAIADKATYLTIYRKAITCDFEEQLAQYWHMFGYKVNRVETPKLRSRMRFNHIKTIGANIEGSIESHFLAQIKAIYDNGVTIWHYTESDFHPLDYTYENIERSLL